MNKRVMKSKRGPKPSVTFLTSSLVFFSKVRKMTTGGYIPMQSEFVGDEVIIVVNRKPKEGAA